MGGFGVGGSEPDSDLLFFPDLSKYFSSQGMTSVNVSGRAFPLLDDLVGSLLDFPVEFEPEFRALVSDPLGVARAKVALLFMSIGGTNFLINRRSTSDQVLEVMK